jgi:hypothetical protein
MVHCISNVGNVKTGSLCDFIYRLAHLGPKEIFPDRITQFISVHDNISILKFRERIRQSPRLGIGVLLFLIIGNYCRTWIRGRGFLRLAALSLIFGLSFLFEFALSLLKGVWIFRHAMSSVSCRFNGKVLGAPCADAYRFTKVCPHLQTLRVTCDCVPHAGHRFCQVWGAGFFVFGSAAFAARSLMSRGPSAC